MIAARLAWMACLGTIACRDTASTSIVVMPRAGSLGTAELQQVEGFNYSPRDMALGWRADSLVVGHVESFANADLETTTCAGTGVFVVPFSGGGPARPLRVGTPVCDALRSPNVALRPDANAIIYSMSAVANTSQLLSLALNDSVPRVISGSCSPYAEEGTVSGDNSQLAMSGLCDGRDQREWAVYVSSIVGENRRRVIGGDSVSAVMPSWSPDSRSLAVRLGDANASPRTRRLAIVEVASRSARPLVAGSSPRWSPDGEWIAFVYTDTLSLDDTEIRIIRPDGSQSRTIFRNASQTTYVRGFGPMREGMVRGPLLWTSDSHGIVFGRAFDRGISLWHLDLRDAQLRQVTESQQ